MNADTHRSETTTDKTNGLLELPADAGVLGTDGLRSTHYYSRETNQVIIVDTRDIVTWYDLGRHSILTWVTVVASICGWRDLSHAEWFLELLAEGVVGR